MKYRLTRSSNDDIKQLIEFKKKTIYKYKKNLSENEINKINNYISHNVSNQLANYHNIVVNNKIIGCVLLIDIEDGKLLDEIYIEEEYRNSGIGTSIIKRLKKENKIIYLWVHKKNNQAILLYKRLGFNIISEADSRYYMKLDK